MRTPNVDSTLLSIMQQASDLRETARRWIKEHGDEDSIFDALFTIDAQLADIADYLDAPAESGLTEVVPFKP